VTPVIPDIAGFADAQDRLRQQFGQNITFKVPQAKTWPAGTAIDPESGEPYDPTVVPTSGANPTLVTKKVNVIFKPLIPGRADDVERVPLGVKQTKGAALLASPADYPDIQGAVSFELNGREYRVSDQVPDGLTTVQRYVIFGEPT
jgi:hypothetical protein